MFAQVGEGEVLRVGGWGEGYFHYSGFGGVGREATVGGDEAARGRGVVGEEGVEVGEEVR